MAGFQLALEQSIQPEEEADLNAAMMTWFFVVSADAVPPAATVCGPSGAVPAAAIRRVGCVAHHFQFLTCQQAAPVSGKLQSPQILLVVRTESLLNGP